MSLIGTVVKSVAGVASGAAASFMPYIFGVAGAVILGLAATVGFDHYVTIPHWQAQAALNLAAVDKANAATQEANNNLDGLRNVVDDDNRKLEALAHSCMQEDQAADLAGERARAALPAPPTGRAAADVMSYWTSLHGRKP